MSCDKILINGLKVDCVVGILPAERTRQQLLRLNLELDVDFNSIQHAQDYESIVDYGAVSSALRALISRGEYLLLETLAEEACAMIFKDYAVSAIRLTIEKPEAVEHADFVGIEVYRCRP
ncbi:MAG: dihydroneopterin aldolase [Myxococcota bacterium]|nr:dihydroneopterin aldolase [Myxococcota bacterium]